MAWFVSLLRRVDAWLKAVDDAKLPRDIKDGMEHQREKQW